MQKFGWNKALGIGRKKKVKLLNKELTEEEKAELEKEKSDSDKN